VWLGVWTGSRVVTFFLWHHPGLSNTYQGGVLALVFCLLFRFDDARIHMAFFLILVWHCLKRVFAFFSFSVATVLWAHTSRGSNEWNISSFSLKLTITL
jgi:hypothetical protein